MDVTLPNGQTLYGVPDSTTKKDAASLAIGQGLASLSDFPDLFPNGELPKPEGDNDPTIMENVGGVIADLGIGTQRATKGLVDLAAIPIPEGLEKYTTDPLSEFFERGIEATEWIKPEAYKEAQRQTPIKRDEEGNFAGFQAPSWQSVAGITAGSLPQIPSFLVGGSAVIKGLKGAKWLAAHPKFAEAIGYGIVNASLVAPGQWRETYKEALDSGISDEEARDAADAAALLTAAVSGTTGAAGGAIASRMGVDSKNLATAMGKGFVMEAPFEGIEEAGQSAASDIAMGREVSGVNALEAASLGTLGGGVPGAGIAGMTHFNQGRDTFTAPTDIQRQELELRRERAANRFDNRTILSEAYAEGRGTEEYEEIVTDPKEWATMELLTHEIDYDEYLDLKQEEELGSQDATDEIQSWIDDGWVTKEELQEIDAVMLGLKSPPVGHDVVTRGALNSVNRMIYDIGKHRGFDEGDVKKITKALHTVTNENTNDTDRVDALNTLARVAGTDPVIASNLSKAQDILTAAKTQPVKPVTRTPIDMEKYGKFTKNLEKRLKQVGLSDMGVTLRHKLEEVAEDHNGNILYGIRPYRGANDDSLVAYDKEGKFVYDDKIYQAKGFFDPTIGRIFISIDNNFTDNKTEKEAMDGFMKTMNHEIVHGLKSLDLFTGKEWNILLEAAKKNKHKNSEETYFQWADRNYRDDLDMKGVEEEAISELIGQEAVTGLPRVLINRLKVFIGQLRSALKGTGYQTFESIVQDVSTGKVGKRDRGVVRTFREMGAKGIASEAIFENDQEMKEQWSDLNDLLYEKMGANLNMEELNATDNRYGNLLRLVQDIDSNDMVDSQTANQIKGKATKIIERFRKNAENNGMTEDELQSGIDTLTFRAGDTDEGFETADPYSKGKQIIYKLQDKLVGLKGIEEAISKARIARGGSALTARESAYIGEELSHGRIGERAREFVDGEVKPMIQAISDAKINGNKVELADLDEFLVLRHAIERNARIRKVNPHLGVAGSGSMGGIELTDDFVKGEMLDRFGMEWVAESGTWRGGNRAGQTMQALASQVDNIVQNTLSEAHDGQLLTEGDFDSLRGFYKYYTPLRGFGKGMLQEIDEENDYSRSGTAGTGGSISILGKHAQKAKGRTSEAFSPTATIIADRERTISRAVKNNDIGNRLLDLVESNPDPDTWELIGPGHPRYDRQWDNSYTYVGQPTDNLTPGVSKKRDLRDIPEDQRQHWVKQVKGVALENPINARAEELIGVKKGGEQFFIDIKDAKLRKSLLNLDSAISNPVIQTLGNINRFLSFVNTTLNPEFVIGNFSRDIQTAVASIINEKNMPGGMLKEIQSDKVVREVIGKGGKNLLDAGKVFYKKARGKELSREDNEAILEFLNAGAKADWFHSKPVDQQRANLQRMLDIANGNFKGNSQAVMHGIKSFVEDGNAAVENAVRFSTFKVAKQKFMDTGMSQQEAVERAASMAKNMTINFNRKGDAGNLLNSMYLFFNAQVQGTAVIARGLKSPTKRKILGGIVSMGAFMSMLHEMSEDEDDPESMNLADVPDFVRERNMIVPLPGAGNDVKVPLPYGYNFFYQLGSNMYLMARGKMKPGKVATELAHTFLGSFNPMGSPQGDNIAATALKMAVPTAGTPLVELTANQNYFGSPIYKEQFDVGTPIPDSHRTFKNSNEILKSLMQGINEMTGGNSSESGAVDISPDTISYLIGYGLGGAGAFGERMWMKPAGRVWKGKKPFEEYNDIPFVRRFIHEYTDKPDMEAYYNRRDRINQKTDHYQKLTGGEQKEYITDNIEFLRFKEVYQESEKQLRVLRQQQKEIEKIIEMYPDRAEEYSENQERIEDSIDRIIKQVNTMFDEQVGRD